MARRKDVFMLLIVLQIIFIILFGCLVNYDEDHSKSSEKDLFKLSNGSTIPSHHSNRLHTVYPMFQDVHVMMFIGFGFLMTFLKKYGYSAVSLNFLVAALLLQWATLCQGFYHMHEEGNKRIHVGIFNLLNADLATASVLISFGAVLGVTTPLQLIVMAICEMAVFATNEHLGLAVLKISDVGASILVHVFGAYFGLAVSAVLNNRPDRKKSANEIENDKEGASYNSDLSAMIGTIFLWLFWPSFNAVLASTEEAQQRAVVNTYFSLTACCVTAFAMSILVTKDHKFDMVHIQNSTLAGGVAIGTAADMMIQPWGSMVVGMIAGTISVLGYRFLSPLIRGKLGIQDTCGVNNLHGMPGILAAIVGAITAGFASQDRYGFNLYLQFPARIPIEDSIDYQNIKQHFSHIQMEEIMPGIGRTAGRQAAFQIAALFVTLSIALIGGLLTGLILRIPILGRVSRHHLFDDEPYWEIPEEETFIEDVEKLNVEESSLVVEHRETNKNEA